MQSPQSVDCSWLQIFNNLLLCTACFKCHLQMHGNDASKLCILIGPRGGGLGVF